MFLLLATPALAGTVAAGPLVAPDDGSVACGVANVSATRSVEYTVTIRASSGGAVHGPFVDDIGPLQNTRWQPPFLGGQLHCIVEVANKDTKNLRVTFMTLNANDETVAAIPGQ
jgi:hypothetical protein